MKPLNKVVRINRAKWRSGGSSEKATGKGSIALLNQQGYMCCLGFAAHQLCRKSKNILLNKNNPDELDRIVLPLTKKSKGGFIYDTTFSAECINVNDDRFITRKQRERKLIRKFNAQGIDLQFYGKYTDYYGEKINA